PGLVASPPATGVAAPTVTSPLPGVSPASAAATPRPPGVSPTPACPPAATGPLTSAARSGGSGDRAGSSFPGGSSDTCTARSLHVVGVSAADSSPSPSLALSHHPSAPALAQCVPPSFASPAPISQQHPFSYPQPLFAPTTLLVGDSIIRRCRFFNATTHCFPGATVPTLLDKLPGLLQTAPPTITRIIIHIGTNDTSHSQSELTKLDFLDLFTFLVSCGKSVFISSPLPTLGHGAERFSRILALTNWLKHSSLCYNFGFIDNFNLFWDRCSFYQRDGLHINHLGTKFLTANIIYAVQSYKLYD
uniref:SGNH hydrolase-type esterase domain-containing protein n=1 Tax=Oryzias latipes TaxID=8090 RepID=A0A3P9HNY2_ORYLA